MRASRLSLVLLLAVAVSSCGKQHAANGSHASSTTPATALAPPAGPAPPAATAVQRQDAGLAPRPNNVLRPNEDGSETVEAATGDGGLRNPLLTAVASTMAAATPTATAASAAAVSSPWQEGVNYTRLVPAQPTSVAAGQVEVLEFFWYACPHCYAIDPLIESWKKSKPAYISFSRVPVMWSDVHRSTARLYYTLESLGKLEQLHGEVFKEVHINGDPLVSSANPSDAAAAERLQVSFLKKFGIPEDVYTKAAHSFAVETAMQRADQLVLRFRIEGVPTFVINGKYVADVRAAGSPERLISMVGDLAAQEHKH